MNAPSRRRLVFFPFLLLLLFGIQVASALLPVPTRPTQFPLQRPQAAGDLFVSGSQNTANGFVDAATLVPVGLTGVVQVSMGGDYNSGSQTVVLKSDGTVVVWGSYREGGGYNTPWVDATTAVPAGLNNIVQVAAGRSMAAVLKSDGTVVAWGGYYKHDYNLGQDIFVNAQTSVPASLPGVVQLAVSDSITLALKSDGTVVAWGLGRDDFSSFPYQNVSPQSEIPTGLTDVVQIVASGQGVLALKSNGTVVAWGKLSSGVTLTGETDGWTGIVQVAMGARDNIFGLKNDGTVLIRRASASYDTYPPTITWEDISTVGLTGIAQLMSHGVGPGYTFQAIKADGLPVQWFDNGFFFSPNSDIGKAFQVSGSELSFTAIGLKAPKITGYTSNGTFYPNIFNEPNSRNMGALAGEAFSATFSGTSGVAPYTYQVILTESGTSFPAGMSLSTNGILSGTPTTAGYYDFQVKITDANLLSSSEWYYFNVPLTSVSGGGYTFTNFVGSPFGFSGSADGTGRGASFSGPTDVAVDAVGNIYFSERENDRLRKVTPTGVVTTLASGFSGSSDLTGGLSVDQSGNIYVASSQGVRKFTSNGTAAAFYGSAALSGSADGSASSARFNQPGDIAVDSSGNIYVADGGNHAIRKITTGGSVTTIAGVMGSKGNSNGAGATARFNNPQGISVDAAGNIYVADTGNCLIRKITPGGTVSTLAGAVFTGSSDQPIVTRGGFTGSGDYSALAPSVDGTGTGAKFSFPMGITVDSGGNIFVTDSWTDKVRQITPSGVVTTIGGNTENFFVFASGIAADPSGKLYIADFYVNRIAVGTTQTNVTPTVTSPASAGITATTATLGGNVTGDGGATIIARGVVIAPTATNNSPQIGGTGVTNVSGNGTTGVFTVNASSLAPGTAYTFAAYATNSVGTAYSITGNFTTLNGVQAFRVAQGLAANGSQDTATPSGDGVASLLKYAFNMIGAGAGQAGALTTPNAATLAANGSAGLPLVGTDNSRKLQLTYIRRKASTAPGISYRVEFSDALASWAVNGSATESVTSIDTTFERVTVTDSSSAVKRFVRVRVSTP